MSKVRLTELTTHGGWAAKVSQDDLVQVLHKLKKQEDPNLLVGFDTSDDAAVYKLNDSQAIIETVDLFPPMVDDPYSFGMIAAANALSDIYAMGGKPILALNILEIPEDFDQDATLKILKGGQDKCIEAGALLTGGHTIKSAEPKYGLAVTGIVDPAFVKENSKLRKGDVLILTKPLGTGILNTAIKANLLTNDTISTLISSMCTLNKDACEKMLKYDVSSVTDVTGFGLIGHALEMAIGSDKTIEIESSNLPLLPEALEYAKMGIIPAGAYKNRDHASCSVEFSENVPLEVSDVMFDPQTSGGLLIGMNKKDANKYIKDVPYAKIIGKVTERKDKYIMVK